MYFSREQISIEYKIFYDLCKFYDNNTVFIEALSFDGMKLCFIHSHFIF